jgi:RES domain-containing protein
MAVAWRIVKAERAVAAFDGEGARLYGGRWNSPGVRVAYTSGSKALAALETLVHLTPPVIPRYVIIPLQFDDAMVEVLPTPLLPPDWTAEPPPSSVQRLGDAWVKSGKSPVLTVPSVLTGENNFLLNPDQRDFRRIRIGKPEPFAFDPRLLR